MPCRPDVQVRDERDRLRTEVRTVREARDTQAEKHTARVEGLTREVAALQTGRKAVQNMVRRLREEMTEHERRLQGWYRDRRDVVTQEQFETRCAMWTMVRGTWERMECAAHVLNRNMGDIVADVEGAELTNNEAYEAYEDDVTLREPVTYIGIFRHEREAIRMMTDADPFEGLPTVTLVGGAGEEGGNASRTGGGCGDAGGTGGDGGGGDGRGAGGDGGVRDGTG